MSSGLLVLIIFAGFVMAVRKHGGKIFKFGIENQDTIRRIFRR